MSLVSLAPRLVPALLSGVLLLAAAAPKASDEAEFRSLETRDGTRLRYAVVLPQGFDPAKTYPVLLALPPGPQDDRMVRFGLSLYWGDAAARRGWVVASPVAPGGRLFFQGSERYLPELLDHLAGEFHVEGGKFHLAGVSNGGLSAFRLALDHPQRFFDLVVLPGVPPREEDFAHLDRLRGLSIALFVGALDEGWRERSQRTADELARLGIPARFTAEPGEGHVLRNLRGHAVIKLLDGFRHRH